MRELCLKRLIPVLMILSSIVFMTPNAFSADNQDVTVVHNVVFWFKPGTAETVVETVIAEVKKFESLPMVRAVYVGKALMSDRDVVDDSFSVMLTLVFDSEQNLRQYESDPYHQRVSQEIILPHVIKGVVYDYFN
jgi:hypothetical protein